MVDDHGQTEVIATGGIGGRGMRCWLKKQLTRERIGKLSNSELTLNY